MSAVNMSAVKVRRFHRSDRADLTRIANAHVAALLPGAQLSTQRVLAQLEDEPQEIVTNPWVDARSCLVAERGGTVVSLALVVHYSDAPETSESLRGLTSLRWVVGDVDDTEALDAVVAAATQWALAHRSRELGYEGVMPVPGCHGAPEAWPHVIDALDRNGFDVGFDSLETWGKTPVLASEPVTLSRSVGICGTRFSKLDHTGVVGFLEVEAADSDRGAFPGSGRVFDIGNFSVRPGARESERDRLLQAGEDWCARAGASWLIAYVDAQDAAEAEWMATHGFTKLGSCRRGRRRTVS